MTSCCPADKKPDQGHCETEKKAKRDYLLLGSSGILLLALLIHFLNPDIRWLTPFSHAAAALLGTMWWGIVLGALAIGMMQKVPREYFAAVLGRGDTFGGLFRAALAGLLLDLCSHGILMVGAKLYERGASLAQVMTFLIASPWNSLSLTLILVSLIGLKWTLLYIAGSLVIAMSAGFCYMLLTKSGRFSVNPNATDISDDFNLRQDFMQRLRLFRPAMPFFTSMVSDGIRGSKMVVRWLFFGTIVAAAIRTFVPATVMTTWFGPTLAGLGLTLLATTLIEVCSEGSAPIAAEFTTRAHAPGNGFTFLMAGVATDYTEIMVVRDMTASWKTALSLPLLTVPQTLLIGWLMNMGTTG